MNIHDVLKGSIGDDLQRRDSLRWYTIIDAVEDKEGRIGTVIVREKRNGTIYHESLRFFLHRYLFRELPLWTYKEEVEKDENGKVIMEDGKPKKKKVFYKKMSSLFTANQVQEAKQPKKKKTNKKGKAA